MAPKTAALTILVLLLVSLVFADRVKCQPQRLDGGQGQELVRDGSGSGGGDGVPPKNDCNEEAMYHGSCVEMNHGGHCKGGFFGACMCIVCS
ncbi:hypothetical protein C2845_PM15G05840 [Panicum miliaceum]|uniref:Uncharacterized protein n=1 Tax=Panicum miliaceum TaxID=4540 RepID=A0A3L6QB73_PANMI|nr:hypothetical protein C2845_PM15G05840 [Panicum miliaceum]